MRRLGHLAIVVSVWLAAAAPATAGQLIDRNAAHPRLEVNAAGVALVTYTKAGRLRHTIAWGGINARLRPARPGVPQVKFKVDYSGGWGAFHDRLWTHFGNVCGAYDGPKLPWLAAACKAPDGSYWALQDWQVAMPNFGVAPWLTAQRAYWLRLAHWRGPLPKLEAYVDWIYSGRYQEVFGRYTYLGRGIRGFGTTDVGAPTDDYGRLLYLDTRNSVYGRGWKRANAFISHGPPGMFCAGLYPHAGNDPGNGDRYRITAAGPGVMPDVLWQGKGLHDYDSSNAADVAYERRMNATLDRIRAGSPGCSQR
jgi:hypothetical protein